MVSDGTMSLQSGTWADTTKGKIKMENKETKKYMVMSKFTHSDRFMLEKQFINKHSADYYVNAMLSEKEYEDLEYFLSLISFSFCYVYPCTTLKAHSSIAYHDVLLYQHTTYAILLLVFLKSY